VINLPTFFAFGQGSRTVQLASNVIFTVWFSEPTEITEGFVLVILDFALRDILTLVIEIALNIM
jgi:hypothetical protein